MDLGIIKERDPEKFVNAVKAIIDAHKILRIEYAVTSIESDIIYVAFIEYTE